MKVLHEKDTGTQIKYIPEFFFIYPNSSSGLLIVTQEIDRSLKKLKLKNLKKLTATLLDPSCEFKWTWISFT